MRHFGKYVIGALVLILVSCQNERRDNVEPFQVFEELAPNNTGILFSNTITPDVGGRANLLDFDYFYNGAGVGIGDINNDGLPDVFLCGNQVANKLFLNKGGLKFEDITAASGVNDGKQWANGVTFVDINRDGWLDIYVSQGGPLDKEQRGNTLYINNKDLTFTESAASYGLDDKGISTQSAFFDYDQDGDMDCIVMNESDYYGYDPVTFHRLLLENEQNAYTSYSHLYRNDEGSFVDVTVESGITAPTFGLGLAISDVNEDGWLDIYIANDYYQPDNLYINKKNGTFSDRSKAHISQMSFFGMGVDIADINSDGHQDIFVLDMASKDHIRSKTLMASMDLASFDLLVSSFGFPYQYMFNALLLNDGRGRFNNMSQLAGVAKTDWSWAVLMEDFDQDQLKDIFVTNGYRKYGTDNDFKKRVEQAKIDYDNNVPLSIKEELYESIPSEALPNNFFKQVSELSFVEVHKDWGISDATYSNGAASGDLDGDGDLDLITNNMDGLAQLYENKSSDHQNYLNVRIPLDRDQNAIVTIKYGTHSQMSEVRRVRGYMSSVEPLAHFGLGQEEVVDEVTIQFLDGTSIKRNKVLANQTLIISDTEIRLRSEGSEPRIRSALRPVPASALGVDYVHKENVYNDFTSEILLPYKQSSIGPCISKTDLNDDDIEDLYIGGASGQSGKIYLSDGDKYKALSIHAFEKDEHHEDVAAVFLDLDGDNDQDLIVLSGGNAWTSTSERYHDRIYINDGTGQMRKKENSSIASHKYVGGVVAAFDYDHDGDEDVLIGNRILPQRYPLAAPSYLFENQDGELVDVTPSVIPALSDIGIVNDIDITDIDGDGWEDIIVVGEWESPKIFKNVSGRFELLGFDFLASGLWFSVTRTDIDGDGDPDFLLGNIGENFKLHASATSPLLVYAGDMDDNNTHDLVLSKKYKGEYVPVRGKECSSEQLPFIDRKFDSYESYASSSLIDVYGEENLDKTYSKSVTSISSIMLINEGDMNFAVRQLPRMAQGFPIRDALSIDLNNDGEEDLITLGTIYDTEVETPRLDGGHGLVLINKGGQYQLDTDRYYLYISGDLRAIDILPNAHHEDRIVVMRNSASPYFLSLP